MCPTNIFGYKYLVVCLYLFTLISCTRQDQAIQLGEAEYYFDDKLSSITIDSKGTCWLGTNTGDIINFSNNNEQISLGEDRIYKILESSVVDSLYWIGVRNSGLQYWKIATWNTKKLRTYRIGCKGDKYSVYDLVECGNSLYVATSQGLYKTDNSAQTDTLTLCYPEASVLQEKSGFSYVVNKLFAGPDSTLLVATEDVLLLLNINTNSFKILSSGHAFDDVTVNDNVISALSQGIFYQFNLAGDLIKKTEIENHPKVYYQANGYHYFISADRLLLSQDLERFSSFPLRRRVPLSGRNVVASDVDRNFNYLLTDRALWRLSNHIDAFKQGTPIILATTNGINNLFLSDKNDLFIQTYGDKDAKWIYRFDSSEHIKWMKAIDDDLFYVTVDNKVRKITPSYNQFKNELVVHPEDLYCSQAKITAFDVVNTYSKPVVILGVQDGMVKIYADGAVDTIPHFSDKYITSIFNQGDSEDMYYATLNHGIYNETSDKSFVLFPKTDQISFINDVIRTQGLKKTLIYLTNHQIISAYPSDSVEAKGYSGLLYLNDSTFYALPEYGIRKLRLVDGKIHEAGLFYRDIRFDKWSSFIFEKRVYLGSNLGVLILDEGREDSGEWLTLQDPLVLNWTYIIFILPLLIVLFVLVLYFKIRLNSLRNIKAKVADLKSQLSELLHLSDYIDKQSCDLATQLLYKIEILVSNKSKRKDIIKSLEALTQDVYALKVDITLELPHRLANQAKVIASTCFYDRFKLLNETDLIKESKSSSGLKNQLIRNDAWFKEMCGIEKNLLQIKDDLLNCLEIEGLTNGLYLELLELLEAIKHKPFDRLTAQYQNIVDRYNAIHTHEGLLKIEESIQTFIQSYLVCNVSESFKCSMLSRLRSFNLSDNPDSVFDVLKTLYQVEQEYHLRNAIEVLSNYIDKYTENRERLNEMNDKLVNRKFDADLDSFIADHLQDYIEHIEQSIVDLYAIIEVTDSQVLKEFLKFKNNDVQQAKVLALLIANPKVKRTYIPGMLGVFGNLNPVISRLVSGKIKPNSTSLESYNRERNIPSLFVDLLLSLLD